jgi:hypothetical protein
VSTGYNSHNTMLVITSPTQSWRRARHATTDGARDCMQEHDSVNVAQARLRQKLPTFNRRAARARANCERRLRAMARARETSAS